jgi:hypothetical protein
MKNKTYTGTFEIMAPKGSITYTETITAKFKFIARIQLKIRNSAKLISIESI